MSLHAIYAFCFCSSIELYINKVTTQVKANIISCIIFQILFIVNSILILNTQVTQEECKNNLQLLYGYFFYGTINLLLNLENAEFFYIIHHILSLYILSYISDLNLANPYYATSIALIGKFQNPILNLKVLIQDYPSLKKINKILFYYLYIVFRITLFPIYSILFLYSIELNFTLIAFFICIYTMSFNWVLNIAY